MSSSFLNVIQQLLQQKRRFFLSCLIVLVFCVLGFSCLAWDAAVYNDRSDTNLLVTRWVHAQQTVSLDLFAIFVTELAGKDWSTVLNVLIVLAHTMKKQYLESITYVVMLAIAGWMIAELKGAYEIPRPDLFISILPENGYSFPSGHSCRAAYVYGYLFSLTLLRFPFPTLKPALLSLFSLIILGVMWSRIYLGVHFLTDVLAGSLVGIFCLVMCLLLREYCAVWMRKN